MSLVSLTSRRALVTNAAGNTLGMVAQLAVSFFMAPIVVDALGGVRNGVWSFIESILAYMMLFDLGVGAALVRFVPRHVAVGDRDGLNRVFSTCLVFFGVAAIGVTVVGGAFALVAPHLFRDFPVELTAEVRLTFLVAVVNFAISLPLNVFPSVLDGLGALAAKNAVRTTFLLVRVPALLAVLGTDARLFNMALVMTGCTVFEYAVQAVLVFRRLPGLRFAPSAVNRASLREIRGYSLDSFLAMLAGRFSFQTDAFVIGRFLGPESITYFAFGNKLVDLSKAVLRCPTWALTPAVSALDARGDATAVRACYLRATRLALYLTLPVQAGLYVFGAPFLAIWLRRQPEIATAAVPTMYILAAMLSFTVAQSVASRVLHGLGTIRLFSRVALLEGIVNVAVSVALVGPLGIEGVAVGTVVPHIAFCVFVLSHLGRLIGVRMGEYIRAAVIAPAAATALALLAWLALVHAVSPTTWAVLFAEGLAGLIPATLFALAVDGRQLLAWLRPPAVTTPNDKSPRSQPPLRAAG